MIPGLGRFPGEGNGNPLQHSCLKNSIPEEAGNALSFPSRIGNYLNLPFGTQGRSRGLNEAYFLQIRNDTERMCTMEGATGSYSVSVLIIVKHLILDCFLYPLKQIRNPYGIRITLPLLPVTSANRFHHINVFPLFPLLTSSSVASCSGWLNWEGYELSLASGMAVSRSSQSVSGGLSSCGNLSCLEFQAAVSRGSRNAVSCLLPLSLSLSRYLSIFYLC